MELQHAEPALLPQGALRQRDGSVVWRVWAPQRQRVDLVTWPEGQRREVAMNREPDGCFVYREAAAAGLRYAYRLDGGPERPDPASRWQPDGVHGPSAVYFPDDFPWSDGAWRGIARQDLVIYELHIGTFTAEGTFESCIERLPELRALGVTAIEIMPVAQFAGERNWGYDGAHPFAAQNSYGGPRGLQQLVDAAHRVGLAVLLDVVYNHLGPEGNYLGEYGPYFTHRYQTPWGQALNFDGPDCDPVRQYVVDNACMWVRDFHMDGLRLDAVHGIYDLSAKHILAAIGEGVHQVADEAQRTVHVIAESDQNDVRIVQSRERNGFGLDGVWADDFHHAVHSLLTGERDGYYYDFGQPAQLKKAFNHVFVYDGCYSPFRRRRHGSQVGDLQRDRFVQCIQNHDQVGNRAVGDRFGTLLPQPAQRLAAALLLISPGLPLLFMGEEYGEQNPFPFFCSFGDKHLVQAVREGRRAEFEALAFRWGTTLPDPQSPETFQSAKLSWSWPEGSFHAGLRNLYRDLLAARGQWPALRDRQRTCARLPYDEANAEQSMLLIVERGAGDQSLLACANLSADSVPQPALELGERVRLFSTEDARYGGVGEGGDAMLRPYELVLFGLSDWRR